MKEDTVEKRLQRRCARAPFTVLCVKAEVLGKGWPDRILLAYPGRVAFAELKRPKGPRRPRQIFIGALLRSLGFHCEFLDSLPGVDVFVDHFIAGSSASPMTVEEGL